MGILALLLLWNPLVPGEDPHRGGGGPDRPERWLLVDPHPLLGPEGEAPGVEGLAREVGAQAVGLPGPGEALEVGAPGALPAGLRRPGAPADRDPETGGVDSAPSPDPAVRSSPVSTVPGLVPLARGVELLTESGAGEITALTPLRGDAEPLLAALSDPALPPLNLRVPATGVANVGVTRLELRPGEEGLEGEVHLSFEGLPPGREGRLTWAWVRAEEAPGGEGEEIRSERVALVPDAGGAAEAGGAGDAGAEPGAPASDAQARAVREARAREEGAGGRVIPFTLPLPPDSGEPAPGEPPTVRALRVSVHLLAPPGEEADGWPLDDVLEVELPPLDPTGGILLLSLRPDPEPRALLPFLERATGLEGEGWIQVSPDRFLALGREGEPLQRADGAGLAPRIAGARLLVLQGPPLESGWPAPWQALLAEHPRRLHLVTPPDPTGGIAAAGPPVRVDPDFPPSQLLGFLAGTLDSPGAAGLAPLLPPLGAVPLPAPGSVTGRVSGPGGGEDEGEGIVALSLRVGGERRPGVRLHPAPGGRVAVMGMEGGWRWERREDAAAAFWRGLWGGLAAWALDADVGEGDPAGEGEARGGEAAGAGAGSRAGERGEAGDASGTVGRGEAGDVSGPPGRTASGNGDGAGGGAPGAGPRVASAPYPLHPRVPPAALVEALRARGVSATLLDASRRPTDLSDPAPWGVAVGEAGVRSGEEVRARRPLRSLPMVWIVLAGLLCLAWLAGRRAGMR